MMWNGTSLAGLAISVGMLSVAAEPARAKEDCPRHVVVEGETLSLLAERYFDDPQAYERLFAANAAVLGPDPDVIEEGVVLTIPCDETAVQAGGPTDGDPGTMADAMADGGAAGQGTMGAPKTMMAGEVSILTGGPFHPFVGTSDADKGLITELLIAALDRTDGPKAAPVHVNDRAAHLDSIMPRGGFDLAAPWVYPDCSSSDLTAEDQRICATFIASDGFFEFVTEFYARADSDWASVVLPGGMTSARFCRPAGYPTHDLTRFGLLPDRITLVTGRDPLDCLMRLDRGEVDIASMDAAVTRALIDVAEVENPIVVLQSLTHVDRLRVLARRDAPGASALIGRLNAALEEMSQDGTWFEIVTRHLTKGSAAPPA